MKTVKETKTYESPKMLFVKTELFENVADECWANPSLYCLVDPTDEDKCGNAMYADLANFDGSDNGCNNNMKNAVKSYLGNTYGNNSDNHYLTQDDISRIMKSGQGNEGTALKTSQYIIQVRS